MRKSGGYSGDAEFEFEIERYKDRETGEFFAEENLPNLEDDFEYDIVSITLVVEGNSYYYPAKYGKYPEDSEPADGDTEIESVLDAEGNDWYNKLTKNERDFILERIAETAQDSSYDYDPPDDFDYDDPGYYQDYG